MEGTGSILMVKPSDYKIDKTESTLKINHKNIRFLSPREIANLHCFPIDFGKFKIFSNFGKKKKNH